MLQSNRAPYIYEDQFYNEGGQVTKLPIYGVAGLECLQNKNKEE